MDKDIARHVATVAIKTSSRLSDLVPLLKEHCTKDEYETYAKALATVVYEVYDQVLKKIYSAYPDLEKEIDAQIKKFGLVI